MNISVAPALVKLHKDLCAVNSSETAADAKAIAAVVALVIAAGAGASLIWPSTGGKRKLPAEAEAAVRELKAEVEHAKARLTVSSAAIAAKDCANREAQAALRRCQGELEELRATNAQLANELTMTQAGQQRMQRQVEDLQRSCHAAEVSAANLQKLEAPAQGSPDTPLALHSYVSLRREPRPLSETNSELDGTEWGGSQISEAVSMLEVTARGRAHSQTMSANKAKFEKLKKERNLLRVQLTQATSELDALRSKVELLQVGRSMDRLAPSADPTFFVN